ncbi:hypothetical protein GCM10010430_21190 [Kitasatospora cystarginea]|uniref:Uncharacterized protein n=1 Tax=Kitasatospora cystarginea TaxID=58350 RepID=A0ABN3DR68_9ACTN
MELTGVEQEGNASRCVRTERTERSLGEVRAGRGGPQDVTDLQAVPTGGAALEPLRTVLVHEDAGRDVRERDVELRVLRRPIR